AVRVARLACAALVLTLAACGGSRQEHHAVATHPTATATTAAPAPPPPPATTTAPAPPPPPPPPPAVPMSWQSAGAFVWHPDAIDPEILGRELRENGFGWAAVFVQDGTTAASLDPVWIDKFRSASGLPLGGWGVLRADPVHEAALVHQLVSRHGLAFSIADAEAAYRY